MENCQKIQKEVINNKPTIKRYYMKVAAIVPAAGIGARLKSSIQKPYIILGNKPILTYALTAISKNRHITEILVSV